MPRILEELVLSGLLRSRAQAPSPAETIAQAKVEQVLATGTADVGGACKEVVPEAGQPAPQESLD